MRNFAKLREKTSRWTAALQHKVGDGKEAPGALVQPLLEGDRVLSDEQVGGRLTAKFAQHIFVSREECCLPSQE